MINITVSKVSVTYVQPKLWSITLHLNVMDDTVELLSKDFSVLYREGESLNTMLNKFLVPMQECIDIYKGEQEKFNLSAWNNFLDTLESSLIY